MTKKQTTEVVETITRTVRVTEFTEADAIAAQQMGIVISGAVNDRISRAVVSFNMAARLGVEAGYLLLSAKGEVAHGDFAAAIETFGLSPRRAQELMQMAKFATAWPESQRTELLTLPKSHVLALAGADAEVIADLLDDDGESVDLSTLSVRELRLRIRDLSAAHTDLSVERDTAVTERDGLAKQLRRRNRDEEDNAGVPLVIADARAEAASLVKKAELAISALYPLGVEITGMVAHEGATTWVNPSLRLALSGAVALRVQLDGLIGSFVTALGDEGQNLDRPASSMAYLDEAEIKVIAEDWARLTATHQHEAALRVHEREQAKPRGKGRPKSAPEAPQA